MIVKNEKSYLISYRELRDKFGIKEEIVFISPAKKIGENHGYEYDYAIEIGVKEWKKRRDASYAMLRLKAILKES